MTVVAGIDHPSAVSYQDATADNRNAAVARNGAGQDRA